jgi:hypothetical protein
VLPINRDQVEALNIMRALEPEVVDADWQAVEALLPSPPIDATRSVVTTPGSRIGCASKAS